MSAIETGASGGDAGLGSFDAMVAEELRDPYPEFARLREQSPVVRQESTMEGAPPAYAVYRQADVTRVLRDGATFSSAVIAQGMAEVWGRKIIVGMDAPEHHRHRALVSVAFRQTTLARWEDSLVRRVVDDLIDHFSDRAQANLVNEFTFAFPAKVIAGVLGLPEADYRQFQQWALGIINVTRDWATAVRCSQELTEYLTRIVDERRHDPREDLITDLVTAELDGEKLGDEEIYSSCGCFSRPGSRPPTAPAATSSTCCSPTPTNSTLSAPTVLSSPRPSRRACATSHLCS
jgi:cytochrome P450